MVEERRSEVIVLGPNPGFRKLVRAMLEIENRQPSPQRLFGGSGGDVIAEDLVEPEAGQAEMAQPKPGAEESQGDDVGGPKCYSFLILLQSGDTT